jgi:hypothetical protein
LQELNQGVADAFVLTPIRDIPLLDVECFLVAEMVIGGSRVGLGLAANRGDGGTPKSGLTTRFSLDISQYKGSFSRIVDVLTCN